MTNNAAADNGDIAGADGGARSGSGFDGGCGHGEVICSDSLILTDFLEFSICLLGKSITRLSPYSRERACSSPRLILH